ncbi:MAG: hypothetical protein LQ342_005755 [Letrouitia transgressa]|nr:MAG: hypothetical protein LQ342_005755 [Letrouitia transgressa]
MSLGPPGASLDPEQAGNFEDMEKQFAVKAVQHMTTYWAILEKMRGSQLRLTKIDDEIYEHFRRDFPEFDPKETIDEDKMKSKEGKEKWRNFMLAYEKKIDDYNFGTMLRSNPKFEYGEKETIFGILCHHNHMRHVLTYQEQLCGCSSTPLKSHGSGFLDVALFTVGKGLSCHRNRESLNDWIYEQSHPTKIDNA